MQKVLGLILLLLVIGMAVGQEPGTSIPIFKSETQLVLVPTVVVDRKGKHIPNLTRRDFTVLEDHHAQPIAFFEEIKPTPPKPVSSPSGVFTNYLDVDKTTAHMTIFALDMVNTPFAGQAQARKILLETLADFVDDGQPKALVIFTESGVRVVHDFTSDPRELAQTLRRFVSNGTDTKNSSDFTKDASLYQRLADFSRPTEAQYAAFRDRIVVQSTVECFREIAKAFAGVPGRKTLVWATGGFPFFGVAGPGLVDFDHTWRILNEANVAIYPVDVREIGIPGFRGANKSYRPAFPQTAGAYDRRYGVAQGYLQEQESASMINVANETGGKACIGRSDLSECFRDAIAESASFYMIGYYLDKTTTKPGWHKLEVKTRLDGAKVRSRTGFEVTDKPSTPDLKTEIETAVVAPLDYTAVPIATKWIGSPSDKEGKKVVSFAMLLPAGAFELDEQDRNHMDFEFMAVSRQPSGQAVLIKDIEVEDHFDPASARKIKSDGFEYHNSLELEPGAYNIRFLIRDNITGKIGSVTSPLKVE